MRGVLVVLLLAAPAGADTPHKEGQYGGVTPGEAQPADRAGKPAKPKRPPLKGTLTWIGFAAKDGGAEVFFQSVAPFEVSQKVDKGALVITLSGLTRLGHNIWRPIDTRFFETPVSRIIARKKGKAVEVRIAFKNGKDVAQAAVHTGNEADGMYYAHLVFGGGSAPVTEPEPAK